MSTTATAPAATDEDRCRYLYVWHPDRPEQRTYWRTGGARLPAPLLHAVHGRI